MATYRVIRAHDGLKLGDIRVLEPSAITEYMTENGYWEEVKEPTPAPAKVSTSSKKKTGK